MTSDRAVIFDMDGVLMSAAIAVWPGGIYAASAAGMTCVSVNH